jgi:hypothetical protein
LVLGVWYDIGMKLMGRADLYNIFWELKEGLVEKCDSRLLEDGSAVATVDLDGEPLCTKAAERTLLDSGLTGQVNICYKSKQLLASLTTKAFKDIGWDIEGMRAANDRKLWVKPCVYGVAHLRDFKWMLSRMG